MSSPLPPDLPAFTGHTNVSRATGLRATFQGGLTVTGTLTACVLEIWGTLNARGARIVGGELRCDGQARVQTLGDEQSTPTRITLGVPAQRNDRLESALEVLAQEGAAIETMRERLALFEKDTSSFSHTEREEMTLAMFDMPDFEASIKRLDELTAMAKERFAPDTQATPELHVDAMIHPGVIIEMHGTGHSWRCEEDMPGPVVISQNQDNELVAESENRGIQTLALQPHDAAAPA